MAEFRAVPSALIALSLALPLAAQEGAPKSVESSAESSAPAEQAEQAEQLERSKKRLLHLASGQVLRGASKRDASGDWLVKRKSGEWITVGADQVARVVEERELLSESKKRLAKVKRDDAKGRVAYASWLADEGLYAESLAQLDRVLEADPDQKQALEHLRSDPLLLAMPSLDARDRTPFFSGVARFGPAARELAVQALAKDTDRPSLIANLNVELLAKTSARRDFAALALRRLFPGEATDGLVRRAVLDPVADVRESAALALRDAENPEVASVVISALGSSHSVVRKHAAQALGVMNYVAAVQPLVATLAAAPGGSRPAASNIFVGRQIAYIQDFDVEVAQGEAIADPQVNILTEGAVLDARVLSTSTSSERGAIYDSLTRLTGAKVKRTPKAWASWLEENGDALAARTTGPRPGSN